MKLTVNQLRTLVRETIEATRTGDFASKEEFDAALPLKGTTITVDGFTGTVFWMGVRQYRGTWNANAGVKDAKGEVKWVPCRTLAG